MIINNLADKLDLVSLKENGFDERSLMVGINSPDEQRFNNDYNKYFVYRAFMIDNQHNEIKNVDMKPCKVHVSDEINSRLMRQAFCVDPGFNLLRGNYNTEQITSQLLQVKAIKCDKKNDPNGIFAKVPKCATDAEMG